MIKNSSIVVIMLCFVVGCFDNKMSEIKSMDVTTVEESEVDSTIYGECGEGTAMHTLQIITDVGDTLDFSLIDNNDISTDIQGGLMVGDKMAVVSQKVDDVAVAIKVINVTTLLGRWASIDKNFVIEEGGIVKSNLKVEKNSWVSWKILNGKLLMNKDTFNINTLGADSLYLENNKGIYVYKRQK